MRTLRRLLFLAVTAGALVTGTTVSAGATPRHPTALVDASCNSAGVAKPSSITLACADGNAVLEHLHWTNWGAHAVKGSGLMDQNDCTPDCAQGAFKTYSVRVALSHTVQADGHPYFVMVQVDFTSKRTPGGTRTVSVPDCFVNPPKPFIPRCPPNLPV